MTRHSHRPLAHPNAIVDLHATADQLQNVPREWLETREDMRQGLHRVASEIRRLAEKIERESARPRVRKIPPRARREIEAQKSRARRILRTPLEQGELAL